MAETKKGKKTFGRWRRAGTEETKDIWIIKWRTRWRRFPFNVCKSWSKSFAVRRKSRSSYFIESGGPDFGTRISFIKCYTGQDVRSREGHSVGTCSIIHKWGCIDSKWSECWSWCSFFIRYCCSFATNFFPCTSKSRRSESDVNKFTSFTSAKLVVAKCVLPYLRIWIWSI